MMKAVGLTNIGTLCVDRKNSLGSETKHYHFAKYKSEIKKIAYMKDGIIKYRYNR